MKTLMNLFFITTSSLPHDKMPVEMYNNSGISIIAFFVFLLLVYLVLSPEKPKKSKTNIGIERIR
jgi:hypothetical protein